MSDKKKDLYKVLGVEDSSPPAIIRKRFHRLSLLMHPDKAPHMSKEYEEVVLAYSVLIDPSLRHEYDELRRQPRQKTAPQEPEKQYVDLKKDYKKDSAKDLDLSVLAPRHQTEIEERHRSLIAGYRERTLQEFKAAPPTIAVGKFTSSDLRRPVRDVPEDRTLALRSEEPEPLSAITSTSRVLVEHQTADDKLGEMYYSGMPQITEDHYILEISRQDISQATEKEMRQPSRIEERLRLLKESRAIPPPAIYS